MPTACFPRARACRRSVANALAAIPALAGLLAGVAPRAAAQPVPAPVGATLPPNASGGGADSGARDLRPPAARGAAQDSLARARRAPWWAALASAVAPGAGQAVLGQPRGIVYGALEVYMWLEYRQTKRFSNRQRDAYRRIAREVARRSSGGARPDGDWDYYERLEKLCVTVLPYELRCPTSGVYDVVPGGEVDPETDLNTYNGQTWALARDTFWPDPNVAPPRNSAELNNALAFYVSRAERPEFFWSWIDQQQAHDEYRRTIESANAAGREATRDLSVIAANHVLSMVDAFVTVRIRRYGGRGAPGTGTARRSGFEATIPWAPFGRPAR